MTKRYFDSEESAKRLKLLMKEQKLTQEQLAQKIGVSRKSINQYCTGKAVPDEYNRKLLCELFKVNEDYLLGVGKYRRVPDDIGDALSNADNNSDLDLPFKVELISRFCKKYNFEPYLYSDKKLEQLEKEITDFIEFKIKAFKEDNSSK